VKNKMDVIRDKVDQIKFRILSPGVISAMSVVKVVNPELYDADGYPIDGGLMDLRMGVISPGMRCRTCGERVKECPGHFGFIKLARPVIHVFYVPWIYDLLKSTCRECGKVLLDEKDITKIRDELSKDATGKRTLLSVSRKLGMDKKAKRKKACAHCGAKKKRIRLNKPYNFYYGKKKLTSIDIREWFEKVSDDDLMLAGFNPLAGRPEWMVLTLVPVPPVTVRPSITLESGTKSEDDLTHKLGDLVRANQRLYENLSAGAPEIIIDDLWDLLQYHVTTLFNNSISQIPPARHRSGRPLKTLSARIKSKQGRFRKNLAGKRVDFSARSVISPDPFIKINEVGIPKQMTFELTIPETVTEWNLKWLKEFVKNGPDNYPGARYVITPDGKKKKISDETKDVILEELAEGYVVERHILDGDPVIFNRQPSLHRMSMMVHKAKILPHKTLHLNLCVCPPYNADFDGDEMNLHVPQLPEARTEAKILLNVNEHLISPRYGLPIIGLINDHILGVYLLTQDGVKIKREDAMDLLFSAGITRPIKKKELTGKEIFSALLPKGFNFELKTKDGNEIKIKDGVLVKGFVNKKCLGTGSGLLIQKLLREYGSDVASEFINRATIILIKYLQTLCISISPSDYDLPNDGVRKIKNVLNYSKGKVDALVEQFKKNKIQAYPGKTMRETLEFKILAALSKARNKCTHIIQDYLSDNGTVIIAKSGARGKLLNLSMISACIGQVALRGQRIIKGYHERALPHFDKNDLGSESHGFSRHGYKVGLNVYEFFFHSISGRNSLMDTSMRTPKSGYLQRRLINSLQDLKVNYDGTVRDSNDRIIQFMYGEDGLDVSKTVDGELL
jgi:DNA-directed RNA polymerase subunit A'